MSESLTECLFGTQTNKNNNNSKNLFDSTIQYPPQPQNFVFQPPRKTDPNPTTTTSTTASTTTTDTTTTTTTKHKSTKKEKEEEPKKKETTTTTDKNEDERTVFVGNLPLDTTRKSLMALFKQCGKVQSARLRSVPTAGVKVAPEHAGNQKLVKKISANTHQLLTTSPKTTSQGYVVFQSSSSVPSALKLNNKLLPDNNNNNNNLRLRVDHAKPTVDPTRSVFVGNLKYGADESTLRQCFLDGCGWNDEETDGNGDDKVCAVRLIRDTETYSCKGFGYVLLKDRECVSRALEMMDQKLYMDRPLRVRVCGKTNTEKKKKKKGEGRKESSIVERNRRKNNGNEKERRSTTTKNQSNKKPRWKPHEKEERKKMATTRSMTAPVTTRNQRKRAKKPVVVKAMAGRTNGISKRAVTGKKRDKKIAKLQKRMVKGMGKTKKAS